MRLITALIFLLLSSIAVAQPAGLSDSQVGLPKRVLAPTPINVACQANPENVPTASLNCAAFELDLRGYTKVWLKIVYTFGAATSYTVFQDGTGDGDDADKLPDLPWGIFQRPTPDAATPGKVDLVDEFGDKPAGASTSSIVEYNVNAAFIRWRFESTGPATVADTVEVFLIKRGP